MEPEVLMSNLERYYSQLTRRVTVLENILLQQFGGEVVRAGQSIIQMLDFNLTLINPPSQQIRRSQKRKQREKVIRRGQLSAVLNNEDDLIKPENLNDDDLKENSYDMDRDYIPLIDELEYESEFECEQHHPLIFVKENSKESHGTEQRFSGSLQNDTKHRISAKLLSLKARFLRSKGAAPLKRCKCVKCGRLMRNARNLRVHLLLHGADTKYKCEFCDQSFRTEFLKNRHMKSHNEYRPFKCDVCELRFPAEWRLRQHIVCHNPENPYTCTHCERQFKFKSAFIRHELIHQDIKPYRCPKCDRKFYTRSDTQRHLRKGHKCFEKFKIEKDPEYERRHPKPVKVRTKKPRKEGGRVNVEGGGVKVRVKKVRSSSVRRTVVCHLCGVRINISSLKKHLRSHDTPFSCEVCQKAFSTEFAMNFHRVQVHVDSAMARPYACKHPGCDARFNKTSTLRQHRIRHTTNQRYRCDTCNKGYKHSNGLRLHNKVYHSDTPPTFTCPYCPTPRCFNRHFGLKRHLQTVHRDVKESNAPAASSIQKEDVGINVYTSENQYQFL